VTRKKSLSSHISRKDPADDEFDKAVDEFHGGSDRVAAILGAALVENNLIKAIESHLSDGSDKGALFHDESSPFGTFKRKIVAVKAMGIVPTEMAADLDIIRDIRNQFAHALISVDFENEHIMRRCDALRSYNFTLPDRSVTETRIRFEKACWGISTFLLRKALDRIEVQKAIEEAKLKPRKMPLTLGDLVSAGLVRAPEVLNDGETVEGGVED
jgi:hypothetical protein